MRLSHGSVSVFVLAAALGRPAAAQPVSGREFRVNPTTSTYEILPQVSADPAKGGFVVVWKESPDCFGERFDASGVRRGKFLAMDGCSAGATVVSLPPGGFVTVGANTLYGRGDVFGRRFDASGTALSDVFASVFTTGGVKAHVRAASAGNGNFVVVWDATELDGSGYGVFGRRFLYSGAPLDISEFRVNTATTGDQRGASVASSATGAFVVVWHNDTGSLPFHVLGQRYDPSGAPFASPFPIGTGYFPDVSSDSAGNFTVVWTSYNDYGNYSYNVHGARFSAEGVALGGPFRVNAGTAGVALSPRVIRRNLDFVVAWQELEADASGYAVLGRRYGSDGSTIGSIFRVNSFTQGDQTVPAIASKPGGGFVVVWQSNGQDGTPGHQNVFGQKYCLSGDANGDGVVDVVDVFQILNSLFAHAPSPIACADVNGDGALDVSDVFYLISHLFAGGPPPI